jgi:hypothetical protein
MKNQPKTIKEAINSFIESGQDGVSPEYFTQELKYSDQEAELIFSALLREKLLEKGKYYYYLTEKAKDIKQKGGYKRSIKKRQIKTLSDLYKTTTGQIYIIATIAIAIIGILTFFATK